MYASSEGSDECACFCADSPEHSLLAHAIRTEISCIDPYREGFDLIECAMYRNCPMPMTCRVEAQVVHGRVALPEPARTLDFARFCHLLIFLKSTFSKNYFRNSINVLKQIRSRSGPTFCLACYICLQTVCKCYQQTTLEGKVYIHCHGRPKSSVVFLKEQSDPSLNPLYAR